jgi:predicted methyltransferase
MCVRLPPCTERRCQLSVKILTGDVRAMLATLPDSSVNVVVTSPPY